MTAPPDRTRKLTRAELDEMASHWSIEGEQFDRLIAHVRARDDKLAAAEQREKRLREALENIARPGHGLQGLIEDGAPEEAITRYWSNRTESLQAMARAALAEGEK